MLIESAEETPLGESLPLRVRMPAALPDMGVDFSFLSFVERSLRISARDIATVPSRAYSRGTNSYKNPPADLWTGIVVERIAAE